MKAMQVSQSTQGLVLVGATVQRPQPGEGEVLIRVHAAGVTPTELQWYPTTHTKSGALRLHAIPGHEFSGTVAGIGSGVDGVTIGEEVFGINDWFAEGATAEYCLASLLGIARKPKNLSHQESATVPIGGLTAWQGLFDKAKLQPGERMLVHGGSGAVGLFLVQLAHFHKAHVIATASARDLDFVKQLGADDVIDYHATRFENAVKDVDVVFDTVGGETLDRSWPILSVNGASSPSLPRMKQLPISE